MLVAPPAPSPTCAALPTPSARPVLLVNDTPSLRLLKRHYLERAGYAVTEVFDGQVALDLLRASPIPLVMVLNTCIPRVDGAGILQAVTDEPRLQRHAFVLTTALARELPEALFTLTQQLQVPVLGKPFTEHDLLAAVAHAVLRLASSGPPPGDMAQDNRA